MKLKKIVLDLDSVAKNLVVMQNSHYNDVEALKKIIENLNEIIINEEHAKTMSAEIPLRRLINEKFAASTNVAGLACGSSPNSIRIFTSQKRTVLPLLNGDYILTNKETKIFKVNKG